MLVLPALIFPFVLGLALYRQVQIPRRLWAGGLRLPGRHRQPWLVATAGAYLALLCYTAALATALVRAFFLAKYQLPAYLSLLFYIAAYPVVHFAAAWIFYYGLTPKKHLEP